MPSLFLPFVVYMIVSSQSLPEAQAINSPSPQSQVTLAKDVLITQSAANVLQVFTMNPAYSFWHQLSFKHMQLSQFKLTRDASHLFAISADGKLAILQRR